MPLVLLLVLVLTVLGMVAGVIFAIIAVRSAPEGVETEQGFFVITPPAPRKPADAVTTSGCFEGRVAH